MLKFFRVFQIILTVSRATLYKKADYVTRRFNPERLLGLGHRFTRSPDPTGSPESPAEWS